MGKDTSLTVNIFGRDISFGKTLHGVGKNAKTATQQIEAMGRKATVVFGAIAAAGVLAAKNAAEDAKSQRILALTLQNTAKATNDQVAAVEKYISKTSLAVGIADDDLRPAFARLTRSTHSTAKSQELLNLALDISASTGKPLELVANTLGKAYDGNTNALGRLGLGIDQSVLKTKNFDKVYKVLTKTFNGFSAQEANTAEGKMRRLNIATDELKETFGYMLLPYLEKTVDTFSKMLPFVERNKSTIGKLIVVVAGLAASVIAVNGALKVFHAMQSVAKFAGLIARWAGFTVAVESSGTGIAAAGAAAQVAWAPFLLTIGAIVAALASIKIFYDAWKQEEGKQNVPSTLNKLTKGKIKTFESNPTATSGPDLSKIRLHAKGGIVTRPHLGIVGEAGPEAIIPLNRAHGIGGTTVHVHVAGSVIAEKDLAAKVRNEIAQLMRRKGLSPSILGV